MPSRFFKKSLVLFGLDSKKNVNEFSLQGSPPLQPTPAMGRMDSSGRDTGSLSQVPRLYQNRDRGTGDGLPPSVQAPVRTAFLRRPPGTRPGPALISPGPGAAVQAVAQVRPPPGPKGFLGNDYIPGDL